MSTRAVIARKTGETWEGVYHHFDGYPTGLGRALYDLLHPLASSDTLHRQVAVLVDEHRGGWSSIIGADWSLTPGFDEHRRWDDPSPRRPSCYCHGDRSQGPYRLLTPEDDSGTEFAYVIDTNTATMEVFERKWEDGDRAFGIGGLSRIAPMRWHSLGVVDLRQPLPLLFASRKDEDGGE